MNNYLIISIFLIITSCKNDDSKQKLFNVYEKDEFIGLISKDSDKVVLFRISEYHCDTMLYSTMEGKINRNADGYHVNDNNKELEFKFSTDDKFLFVHFENDSIPLNLKEDYHLKKFLTKKQRVSEFSLIGPILSCQDEIELQLKSNNISFQTKDLINYIDSLEKEIYLSLNFTENDILCIVKHDSLQSFKSLTKILVDDPVNPRNDYFSANGLKLKLESFLKEQNSAVVSEVIFTEFQEKRIQGVQHSSGVIENWESYNFHGVPLWSVLLKLNQIKLKAIQVDLLSHSFESTK